MPAIGKEKPMPPLKDNCRTPLSDGPIVAELGAVCMAGGRPE
jgi:hypothetical protein